MTYIAFILSMPQVGSWNGRWSGEKDLFCRTRSFSDRFLKSEDGKHIKEGNYYYNFGDGWSANVELKKIDKSEMSKLKKRSKGFCGYDWMIESIIRDGKIVPPSERENDTNV